VQAMHQAAAHERLRRSSARASSRSSRSKVSRSLISAARPRCQAGRVAGLRAAMAISPISSSVQPYVIAARVRSSIPCSGKSALPAAI
jgi:hypothetical protein